MILIASTTVADARGNAVFLPAGSELPDWAAGQVGNHLLGRPPEPAVLFDPVVAEPDEPAPPVSIVDAPAALVPPPRKGRGSSNDAWHQFALDSNVLVDSGATRSEIIKALELAGVSTV